MASLVDVIGKVRRRVHDSEEPYIFLDVYYEDAVEFGLQKLSFDLAEEYSTVPDVPFSRVFLLIKLATIEMCYARASKATASEEPGSTESSESDFASISVPDLSITRDVDSGTDISDSWMKIAQDLQEEYDSEIKQIGGTSNAATIQVGHLKVISRTTGGYKKRNLDRGPVARTLAAAVVGTSVTLSWDIWYSEVFDTYTVYRGTDSSLLDGGIIGTFWDNHDHEMTDTGLSPGTYYYKVVVRDRNDLLADSNIVEAIVV